MRSEPREQKRRPWQLSRVSFVTGWNVLIALLSAHPLTVNEALAQSPSAPNRTELMQVTSKDGTRIGVECAGTSPTLLFVHGGVGDRTRWTPMFPLLVSKFTACAMDRRGRG